MASEPKNKKAPPAPAGVSAYRLDVPGDELVLFVWESEHATTPLAPGEREVLQLVLDGYSNTEIAAVRGTSVRTIANQVASLLKKLGARSRYELIGRLARGQEPASSEAVPRRSPRRPKRGPAR
ncbi:MAG TPA: helix-turn-helix transcriptional regulator [Labilithrix sp.]|nr:helix-turn-helix transcriptional regulator [Labilithrix sp.]